MQSSPLEEPTAGQRLGVRLFAVLTALAVLFILAASFMPSSGGIAIAAKKSFLLFPKNWSAVMASHDLRDITTNVLLYLPFGLFVAFTLAVRRSGQIPFLSLALICGPVLSLSVELTQGLINRTSDIIDILTNSTGFAVGYLLAAMAVRLWSFKPESLLGLSDEDDDGKARTLKALRFLYVSAFFVVALLPFNISVSFQRVYAQLLPNSSGQIYLILDPLYTLRQWPTGSFELLLAFLGLVPVALLTGFIDAGRRRLNLLTPILAATLLGTAGEGLKIFIIGRTSDMVVPFLGVLAGLTGGLIAKAWFTILGNGTAHEQTLDHRRRMSMAGLAGYGLLLALIAWYPFQFEGDVSALIRKLKGGSNWLPFRSHFAMRDLGAAVDLVKETGLYVPFGIFGTLMLSNLFPRWSKGRIVLAMLFVAGGFATFLEATQVMCVGRYLDVTDVLLAAFGATLGVLAFALFARGGVLKALVSESDPNGEPTEDPGGDAVPPNQPDQSDGEDQRRTLPEQVAPVQLTHGHRLAAPALSPNNATVPDHALDEDDAPHEPGKPVAPRSHPPAGFAPPIAQHRDTDPDPPPRSALAPEEATAPMLPPTADMATGSSRPVGKEMAAAGDPLRLSDTITEHDAPKPVFFEQTDVDLKRPIQFEDEDALRVKNTLRASQPAAPAEEVLAPRDTAAGYAGAADPAKSQK